VEVQALRILSKHPNIIGLKSLMYDSQTGHVAMILEPLEMNLLEYLSKREKQLDEDSVLLLMYQLTKAIYFVHSRGLFHRDVKPENCLLNSGTLELKLADFGSVSQIANRTKFTEYVATRWYRAPECILTSGSYGASVDIWAIGCVMFEALTCRPLFPGKHQLDQLNKIHSVLGTPSRDILTQFQSASDSSVGFSFCQREKQSFRTLLPYVGDNVIDLLEKMIVYDPADRISAKDALEHPAYENLRRLDVEWQNSQRKIPFAAYVKAKNSQGHSVLVSLRNKAVLGYHMIQNELNDENRPLENSSSVIDTTAKICDEEDALLVSDEIEHKSSANLLGSSIPMAKAALKPFKAVDSGKLTRQRIIDYNKRHILADSKARGVLGRTGGVRFRPTQVFQKPRAEMVQPRLPPITLIPLKKS
jgi:renal tumor antigen